MSKFQCHRGKSVRTFSPTAQKLCLIVGPKLQFSQFNPEFYILAGNILLEMQQFTKSYQVTILLLLQFYKGKKALQGIVWAFPQARHE